jgi:hypothetical protein
MDTIRYRPGSPPAFGHGSMGIAVAGAVRRIVATQGPERETVPDQSQNVHRGRPPHTGLGGERNRSFLATPPGRLILHSGNLWNG